MSQIVSQPTIHPRTQTEPLHRSESSDTCFDIVIVGGGLVGAAMALALAGIAKRYDKRIAILDGAPLSQPSDSSRHEQPVNTPKVLDGRATALALGSRNLLDSIGMWDALSPYAEPIVRIDVSDQGHPFGTTMDAQEVGQPALGYVAQNADMGQVFWQSIETHCGEHVCIIDRASVTRIDNRQTNSKVVYERADDGVLSSMSPEQAPDPAQMKQVVLTCQLVIVADGGRSDLREQLGIYYKKQSYEQVALVTNVALSRPHHGLACERFTANGPMAVLPLPPADVESGLVHRAAIVWTQPVEAKPDIESFDSEQLLTQLQNQLGYRMGAFDSIGDRQIYPLSLVVCDEQARQGLAVIGNAAHTLHPIAGQGFNLALRGAFALAEQVLLACEHGHAIGDLRYLNRFVSDQQLDQRRTLVASDQVMKLFASPAKTLRAVRQAGLLAMQKTRLAKTVFTRASMGLDTPLARVLPIGADQPVMNRDINP